MQVWEPPAETDAAVTGSGVGVTVGVEVLVGEGVAVGVLDGVALFVGVGLGPLVGVGAGVGGEPPHAPMWTSGSGEPSGSPEKPQALAWGTVHAAFVIAWATAGP
jgi:hypothetical protein